MSPFTGLKGHYARYSRVIILNLTLGWNVSQVHLVRPFKKWTGSWLGQHYVCQSRHNFFSSSGAASSFCLTVALPLAPQSSLIGPVICWGGEDVQIRTYEHGSARSQTWNPSDPAALHIITSCTKVILASNWLKPFVHICMQDKRLTVNVDITADKGHS